MVLAGSLQLSYGLGLCKNQECKKQFKNGTGRSKLHLFGSTLSSRVSFHRQDSWSTHLSDIVYKPRHTLPYRHNTFKCQSFFSSGQPLELPRLKSAAVALTRSFNILQCGPPLPKLAIAAGVTLLAVGLGPFACLTRKLLSNKSDNSWKNSNTYRIITSYIRPLLLWMAAILICMALDPVVLPTEAGQVVKQRVLNFVRALSTVLAFAYCL